MMTNELVAILALFGGLFFGASGRSLGGWWLAITLDVLWALVLMVTQIWLSGTCQNAY
jgi:hypothetical protein